VSLNSRLPEPDEWPEWIFLDIDGGLVPFRPVKDDFIWRDERHIILALGSLSSQEKAMEFIGSDVWFPADFKKLIENRGKEIFPLAGYSLYDSDGSIMGTITGFIDIPENLLFKVQAKSGEILIPARTEWIVAVDEKGQKITMDLPDGLADI